MRLQPNHHGLNWFLSEYDKETLKLNPKYQRNPIWSPAQQCFLIDSIITDQPIPQVYLNLVTEDQGGKRKTVYEVVDGQQRLRAILHFMKDQYQLKPLNERRYPVSTAYKEHVGKRYSELPEDLQQAIWDYSLAVQEVRNLGEDEIKAMFARLNWVVSKLNKQELRHSLYEGEFLKLSEKIANEPFWQKHEMFSRDDLARMKDVEFVSELIVVLLADVQEGTENLDQFYIDYQDSFPSQNSHKKKFLGILAVIDKILIGLGDSRFVKKADFYGIFSALARIGDRHKSNSLMVSALKSLNTKLQRKSSLKGDALTYYKTVIEGPNKKAKRETRRDILIGLLKR